MAICPECNGDLACGCKSCVGRERGRLKEIWLRAENIVECPECGYKNSIDYWEEFSFFLATSGGVYRLGEEWS